jgi:hypothetical protein
MGTSHEKLLKLAKAYVAQAKPIVREQQRNRSRP